MNQNQNQNLGRDLGRHRARRLAAPPALAAVAATLLVALAAAPAVARPDAGLPMTATPRAARGGHAGECLLERVGAQLVRCDDLTGNGVPAPAWIPER